MGDLGVSHLQILQRRLSLDLIFFVRSASRSWSRQQRLRMIIDDDDEGASSGKGRESRI